MRLAAALAAVLLLPARVPAQPPSPSPLPSVELPPALARVLTDYEKAWQAKDAAGLAALFAEDGFVLSSGTPAVRGRAAIERHYAGAGGPLALRALAFKTTGDVGYVIGGNPLQCRAQANDVEAGPLDKGADGRWLIMSDMDNGNARR